MRCIGLLIVIIMFAACHKKDKHANKLNAEIERLKKRAAFKPLKQDEAYKFINNYYLPRLDTMGTGRKIYEHPLTGPNFKVRLENAIVALQHKESMLPPEPINVDKRFKWDKLRLKFAILVIDPSAFSDKHSRSKIDIKAWSKKFGYGYMCISYPLYNPYTRRIVIREWIEDMSFCGTGREDELFYQQTKNGWIFIK